MKIIIFLNFIFFTALSSCGKEEKKSTRNRAETKVTQNTPPPSVSPSHSDATQQTQQQKVEPVEPIKEKTPTESSINFDLTKKSKIMLIGDSITQGGTAANWRCLFWIKLRKHQGFTEIDFVGSQKKAFQGENSNCTDKSFDGDHQGHFGWKADQVLPKVQESAAKFKPDIAFIHLGTNDLWKGDSAQSTHNDIKNIISTLRQHNPKVTIFFGGIIPNFSKPETDSPTRQFNQLNETFAKDQTNKDSALIYVNHFDTLKKEDTFDGVHPNNRGDSIIADNWYNALLKHYSYPNQ